MATQSILLAVTDPEMLVDIVLALGAEWEATSVATDADALEQLEKRAFDALLVDFNLGSPDASELLNQAVEKRPETIRFLLAHEGDLALVAAKVLGTHHILPKPIEAGSLKSRIETGLNDANSDQTASEPATVGTAPTTPSVYSEVLAALDLPGVTNEQVGEIIARDAALTSEVLRLTRSAYMGLPRDLTDPVEAVESLGLETVKALVMALRFLTEHSHLNPGYLSIERIWQHSTNVAQIARDLVLFETKDRTLASQALVGGLLHDLGKVVLATNFDDLYGRVHSLARKQPVPLWEIEKEMFGANHGEIGGCLVGMWNMPSAIVEATAFHHEPPLGEQQHLTPLAAVHIANVLEHQLRPSDEFRVAPIINTPFLNELGLLQRLPVWRARFSNQQSNVEWTETNQPRALTPELQSTLTSRTANQFPEATPASGQLGEESSERLPAPAFWQRRWVPAGFAAGILFLLAFWLRMQLDIEDSAPVHARTPATSPAPAVAASTLSLETVSADAAQATAATAASEAAPATGVPSVSGPVASFQAPVTNVPLATLPSKESVPPDFRLSGIIYGVVRPSAIVNGKIVHVGERVNGATVLRITQTDVTLLSNGVRKTFELP